MAAARRVNGPTRTRASAAWHTVAGRPPHHAAFCASGGGVAAVLVLDVGAPHRLLDGQPRHVGIVRADEDAGRPAYPDVVDVADVAHGEHAWDAERPADLLELSQRARATAVRPDMVIDDDVGPATRQELLEVDGARLHLHDVSADGGHATFAQPQANEDAILVGREQRHAHHGDPECSPHAGTRWQR